jgi:ATP-dependent exoDNAse (exonuclease V) alpha subunit
MKLSEEQKTAIKRVKTSKAPVVILTGQAGSGKTTVVNELTKSGNYAICATTGRAATHVNGVTVDSLFAFDRNNWRVWSESYLEKNMRGTPDSVIIDESSMIGKNMGDLVYDIATAYRKKLILVGDWAQARPVKDKWILDSCILNDYDFIKLTECHRQSEVDYIAALNALRVGDTANAGLFNSRINSVPPDDDSFLRMYATNNKTDSYNNFRFWKYITDTSSAFSVLQCQFIDKRDINKQRKYPRPESFIAAALGSSRLGVNELVAPGCRVLFTRNDTIERLFVNGDTGTVTEVYTFNGDRLTKSNGDLRDKDIFRVSVHIDRLNRVIDVYRMNIEFKDPTGRSVTHVIVGFPMKLGYAVTIHKSQGMSVEKAWVDMGSLAAFKTKESIHGLAYVALSRTMTIDGLYISEWLPDLVYSDPEVSCLI